MIICIESWKGDCLLCGKVRSKGELLDQMRCVETQHDRKEDNFIPLLCRMHGWTVVDGEGIPDCTYDRDTGLILPLK